MSRGRGGTAPVVGAYREASEPRVQAGVEAEDVEVMRCRSGGLRQQKVVARVVRRESL